MLLLVLMMVQEMIEVHLNRERRKEFGRSPDFFNFAKLEVSPKRSDLNDQGSLVAHLISPTSALC